jgi:predicted alpha/beta hydrolase family esterase
MRASINRIIIVPGNGGGDVRTCNWYESVRSKLQEALPDVQVLLPQMKDPEVARESVWVPQLLSLGCDGRTLLIGHSSGAEAAMRLAEKNELGALVLVSACHTDLGIENERLSGYYDRPWQWEAISANCKRRVMQWGSRDDPLVPYKTEQLHVHASLNTELHTLDEAGHIWDSNFDELVENLLGRWQQDFQ